MNSRSTPYTLDEVTIVRRDWHAEDQPELHLELSTGIFVKVCWDISYACKSILVAADEHAEYVTATAEETGLSRDVLEDCVEEVRRAVRMDEDERLADNFEDRDNYEDGRR